MPQTIKHPALVELIDAGAVRALVVFTVTEAGRTAYCLQARVGLSERTLATQRGQVRQFRSLDTVAAYLAEIGAGAFEVKL